MKKPFPKALVWTVGALCIILLACLLFLAFYGLLNF